MSHSLQDLFEKEDSFMQTSIFQSLLVKYYFNKATKSVRNVKKKKVKSDYPLIILVSTQYLMVQLLPF